VMGKQLSDLSPRDPALDETTFESSPVQQNLGMLAISLDTNVRSERMIRC
jgi:hypothetical protein